MRILYAAIACFALVACSSGEPFAGTPEFDAYLEKLMAEPYNPTQGSKY